MRVKDLLCYSAWSVVNNLLRVLAYYEEVYKVFPSGSMVNNSAANAGPIPGSGRSPGKGNGNPFQYSCLGNPMDEGTRCITGHGVTKELDTT